MAAGIFSTTRVAGDAAEVAPPESRAGHAAEPGEAACSLADVGQSRA
nr:hypothetical protein [Burkholderia gladioli]